MITSNTARMPKNYPIAYIRESERALLQYIISNPNAFKRFSNKHIEIYGSIHKSKGELESHLTFICDKTTYHAYINIVEYNGFRFITITRITYIKTIVAIL